MTTPNPQRTGELLLKSLDQAGHLILVSPFIKVEALTKLLGTLSTTATLEVFTRWRPHEVAIGVSDLEVLEAVESFGGTVFLHPLLHAKAYILDDCAWVGSSNATLTGLGWAATSSIEGLFEIPRQDPMLSALLSTLKSASCKADKKIQEEVRIQAQALAVEQTSAEEPEITTVETVSPYWTPQFNVPESVWGAYVGERSAQVQEIVMRDLAALGIPEGIGDRRIFEGMVGALLSQGFTGRLIQECANLNAVDAANKMKTLLANVGVDVPEGALGERYQTFARWVSHFLPARNLRASGYSIV